MSHPDYKHVGTRKDRLIEEIVELLKAIGKAERFGFFNHHPERPQNKNIDEIKYEIDDVVDALEEYSNELDVLQRLRDAIPN